MRSVYALSIAFLVVSSMALIRSPGTTGAGPDALIDRSGDAGQWFVAIKPYCNTLEVEAIQRRFPAPSGMRGVAFSAACYALGGRIAAARDRILSLPDDDRWKAAGIVFDIAHPIADAGDDRSAGPIMELVVAFWPNHHQALYHAGASNYSLGRLTEAERYLEEFIYHYDVRDGFHRNAVRMLADMAER